MKTQLKVVVTGAAGMIGSNLVHGLNAIGIDDVIAVDDLTDGPKYRNLLGAKLSDYFDRSEFYTRFAKGEFGRVDAVFHEGACSDTMEHNGRYMMDTNYRCSKDLLDACQAQGTRCCTHRRRPPTAAARRSAKSRSSSRPLNVYGYSKLLFDNVVRRSAARPESQVAGFATSTSTVRASSTRAAWLGRVPPLQRVPRHGQGQALRRIRRLCTGRAVARLRVRRRRRRGEPVVPAEPAGERHLQPGHGRAQPFNDIALATVNASRALKAEATLTLEQMVRHGLVEYIPFPDALVGKYQCFTQADLARLRAAGCDHAFADVATGVESYVRWLART
jgi:ADP-L-glycero-D-manno-heptose 6-epimerase